MRGRFYGQRVKVAVVYQVDDGPVSSMSGVADGLEIEMEREDLGYGFGLDGFARRAFARPRYKVTVDFGYHLVSHEHRDFEDIPDEPEGIEARRELPPGPIALPGGLPPEIEEQA